MFSSVIYLAQRGSPRVFSGGPNGPPLGPHGPGLNGPPSALMGSALVGFPGPLWVRPLWAPLGTCGPPWAIALVGPPWAGALVASLGPCGAGPCGLPWALMGRALVGPPWWALPGPPGRPWALMGRVLVGPLGPHGPGPGANKKGGPPLTYFLLIIPMRRGHMHKRLHMYMLVLYIDVHVR